MRVLGLSGFYHDAAACLVVDGEVVAAAEEERFSRVKHDARFPARAAAYCLAEGAVGAEGVDAVVFYDKPLLKLHRILETYLAVAPRGLRSFVHAMPGWLREKLWVESAVRDGLDALGARCPARVHFMEHHRSHAASAFYPSPFDDAAVLTVDGVGEWATATVGVGDGASLELLEELCFPHSPGLLYTAFTAFAGFRANSGEYKLMGLAPYGTGRYTARILEHLIDLKPDGSFRLDLSYFGWLDGLTMTTARFEALFDGPPRRPEGPITQRECDLARSVQEVIEEVVIRMARHARALTGRGRLCMAGGVALNSVANGRLLREGVVDELWIQPAAGDAGGALGAALAYWHGVHGGHRPAGRTRDGMRGALLGPEFAPEDIRAFLDARGYPYDALDDSRARADTIARRLAGGDVVAVCDGRMEFGPRALGNRSILADPRAPGMKARLNASVKQREAFRPFAPAVLAERAGAYFELDRPSPYMLLVAPVVASRRVAPPPDESALDPAARAALPRSDLPAVTHVDGSARVQTVSATSSPGLRAILEAFERHTGCAALVNTSFNLRGEPIVCTPEEAYACFMRGGIDLLALGPFLLDRARQPPWAGAEVPFAPD
jgi:carbamoyltransferase